MFPLTTKFNGNSVKQFKRSCTKTGWIDCMTDRFKDYGLTKNATMAGSICSFKTLINLLIIFTCHSSSNIGSKGAIN